LPLSAFGLIHLTKMCLGTAFARHLFDKEKRAVVKGKKKTFISPAITTMCTHVIIIFCRIIARFLIFFKPKLQLQREKDGGTGVLSVPWNNVTNSAKLHPKIGKIIIIIIITTTPPPPPSLCTSNIGGKLGDQESLVRSINSRHQTRRGSNSQGVQFFPLEWGVGRWERGLEILKILMFPCVPYQVLIKASNFFIPSSQCLSSSSCS